VLYREVLSGVPQGSVFWSLLSDIFVNDLHSSLKELKYILFAEGVKNFCTLRSVTDSTFIFIYSWHAANNVEHNIDKTKSAPVQGKFICS
jgi:hypothetical protein